MSRTLHPPRSPTPLPKLEGGLWGTPFSPSGLREGRGVEPIRQIFRSSHLHQHQKPNLRHTPLERRRNRFRCRRLRRHRRNHYLYPPGGTPPRRNADTRLLASTLRSRSAGESSWSVRSVTIHVYPWALPPPYLGGLGAGFFVFLETTRHRPRRGSLR